MPSSRNDEYIGSQLGVNDHLITRPEPQATRPFYPQKRYPDGGLGAFNKRVSDHLLKLLIQNGWIRRKDSSINICFPNGEEQSMHYEKAPRFRGSRL
jgi:hypothetical protein